MKDRPFDARRLDVQALARAGQALAGEAELAALSRLLSTPGLQLEADPGRFAWSVAATVVPVRGGDDRCRLHLQARARVVLQCQRCLAPMLQPLLVDRTFQFAPDEDTAAAWDEDEEDDVLVLTRTLDVHELVEDELILSLPIVPRHDDCEAPSAAGAGQDGPAGDTVPAHPFAALAALKKVSSG